MAACKWRLMEPRELREWICWRRSIMSTAGKGRLRTRRGISSNWNSPVVVRWKLSSDGVAEPRTRGTSSAFERATATSRAWYRGAISCLNVDSCSSSSTIRPRFGTGAKIALRAPTTTCTLPSAICCQCQCRSASVKWLWRTATRGNRDWNRARVCGVRLISGTSTMAWRPKPTISWMAWM